jgi:hypothetical protein
VIGNMRGSWTCSTPFLPHLDLSDYHVTKWRRGFMGAFVFDAAKPTWLLNRKRDSHFERLEADVHGGRPHA